MQIDRSFDWLWFASLPYCLVYGCIRKAVMTSPTDICKMHWNHWCNTEIEDPELAILQIVGWPNQLGRDYDFLGVRR